MSGANRRALRRRSRSFLVGPTTSAALLSQQPASERAERVALLQAQDRIRALEGELALAMQERDQARLDVTDLRVRHVRLSIQLLILQTERRTTAEVASDHQAQLERFRLLEERNRVLEQDIARLRGAIETLAQVGSQPSPTVKAPKRVPWYRRFWFAVIGKDARAAQWSAPKSAP